jgi:hypothetical protein
MRKGVIILFLLTVSLQLSAQVRFGVRAGISMTNLREKYEGTKFDMGLIARLLAGTAMEIPIDEKWMIHSGIYYSGKGTRYDKTFIRKEDSVRIHLNYIELPVSIAYKFPSEGDHPISISGGVYISYGFLGKVLFTGSPHRTVFHLHRKDSYYKRWDLGYNLQTSYEFNSSSALGLEYSASLLNIDRYDKTINRVLNLSFFLYPFRKKDK